MSTICSSCCYYKIININTLYYHNRLNKVGFVLDFHIHIEDINLNRWSSGLGSSCRRGQGRQHRRHRPCRLLEVVDVKGEVDGINLLLLKSKLSHFVLGGLPLSSLTTIEGEDRTEVPCTLPH